MVVDDLSTSACSFSKVVHPPALSPVPWYTLVLIRALHSHTTIPLSIHVRSSVHLHICIPDCGPFGRCGRESVPLLFPIQLSLLSPIIPMPAKSAWEYYVVLLQGPPSFLAPPRHLDADHPLAISLIHIVHLVRGMLPPLVYMLQPPQYIHHGYSNLVAHPNDMPCSSLNHC